MMANKISLLTKSCQETYRLGKLVGEDLQQGDVVALFGDLGSGKTVFAQGIAEGLGVPLDYAITSPTFTIINEYPGRNLIFYHVDLYRVANNVDKEELGFEEYLFSNGVVAIEWAEKMVKYFDKITIAVELSFSEGSTRNIDISGSEERLCSIRRTIRRGGG